jgi:hypothetical protein
MNQMTLDAHRGAGGRNSSQHGAKTGNGQYAAPPLSGFTKNHGNSNIIAHDIVDVRSSKGNTTLQNNGNEIFNSGGYSNSQKASRRSIQEAKFEANFQKPMADRNRSINGGVDYLKNYQHMRAAGGAVNLDQVSKKPSVNDGKSRLFGMGDEN